MMETQYEDIRSFRDDEINAAVRSIAHDPMMKALMHFTFPEQTEVEWRDLLEQIHGIEDFQRNIVYKALQRILAISSEGLTSSGFENLDAHTPYLYISNHRDIALDAAFLNYLLLEKGLIMAAMAIGDNLVKVPFLHTLAKINRNFIVRRGLPPRELLESSKLLSEYIQHLLHVEHRSAWIAQREGRAKDGNDFTHPGVLKMIAMAAGEEELPAFFKKLKIVPVSISYECDPTDALKLPELLAHANKETHVKDVRADFQHILTGISGQKKRIHFHAGKVLDVELDLLAECKGANQQIKTLAQIIDRAIITHYKLWPANYVAYDLLFQTPTYAAHYTPGEKEAFSARMASVIDPANPQAVACFLAMYANPIVNRLHAD